MDKVAVEHAVDNMHARGRADLSAEWCALTHYPADKSSASTESSVTRTGHPAGVGHVAVGRGLSVGSWASPRPGHERCFSVPLPPLSDEVRKAALEKAAFARRERAAVKSRLKHSGASLSSVIDEGHNDDVVGKMRVADLLAAMPGVGKIRAGQLMERIGISPSRRVRGLGENQIAALKREFGEL